MRITFIILILATTSSWAQINLIPDPGFEIKTYCPHHFTTSSNPIPLKYWYSPTKGTPDLFSACNVGECGVPTNWAGTSFSAEGDNYVGIYICSTGSDIYREYISIRLSDSLQKDVVYNVNFFAKPSSKSQLKVDSISFLFTSDSIRLEHDKYIESPLVITTYLHGSDMDTVLLWNIASSEYVASGGERYLTIGNFNAPNTTRFNKRYSGPGKHSMIGGSAYYYIDFVDVSSPLHETPFPINESFVIENIYFEFDEYSIPTDAQSELKRLSDFLIHNPGLVIRIQGHADPTGTDRYNLRLSRRRSSSVKRELVSHGVDPKILRIEAFGEGRTVSKLDSLNRRVEFFIVDRHNQL